MMNDDVDHTRKNVVVVVVGVNKRTEDEINNVWQFEVVRPWCGIGR